MRTGRRLMAVLTGVVMVSSAAGAPGIAASPLPWKGAETFAPVNLGPNPSRCGPFPRNVEAQFVGSGIDTFGGPFSVSASGCLDTEALVLTELEATDTYVGTRDSVRIKPADAVLDFDRATCTAATRRSVPFEVAGGTGALTGARGRGHYDLAFTLPSCAGPQQAVHVWFHGTIDAGHS